MSNNYLKLKQELVKLVPKFLLLKYDTSKMLR